MTTCSTAQKYATVRSHHLWKTGVTISRYEKKGRGIRSGYIISRRKMARLTEFRVCENHPSAERNVWHMFKVVRSNTPQIENGTFSIWTVKTAEIGVAESNGDVKILTTKSTQNPDERMCWVVNNCAADCSILLKFGTWWRRGSAEDIESFSL